MSAAAIIVTGVVAIVLGWSLRVFNRLVRLRNQVRSAWADIDVQLLRRHDLVPQLVASVQALVEHERTTLESLSALRAQAIQAVGTPGQVHIEHALGKGLEQLLLLREAYPALASNAGFTQLQQQLVEVESHLQYARRFYNGAVRALNDAVQRAPDLLIARCADIGPAEFFEVAPGQAQSPRVEMNR